MNNLVLRILSGVAMLAILLAVLFALPRGLTVVFGVITFFCLYELAGLLSMKKFAWPLAIIGLTLFTLPMWGWLDFQAQTSTYVTISVLVMLLCATLLLRSQRMRSPWGIGLGSSYILLSALTTYALHTIEPTSWWALFMMCLVWASDIGGYFIGRFFGHRPLAPTISPKKTIEGFFGGLALALIIGAIGMHTLHDSWHMIGMATIAHLATVLGDLVESKLKRLTAIKDSSQLIPGHGGFLDRCDGLLLSLPFSILYYHFFIG